jgi:polyhydroxyalkanoate synthesis regulator phasin
MTETVGLADDLEELGKLSEQEAQRLVNQLDENAKV